MLAGWDECHCMGRRVPLSRDCELRSQRNTERVWPGEGLGEALFRKRKEQEVKLQGERLGARRRENIRCEPQGCQEIFARFQGQPPQNPGEWRDLQKGSPLKGPQREMMRIAPSLPSLRSRLQSSLFSCVLEISGSALYTSFKEAVSTPKVCKILF